jgi:hypothetical protein
MTPIEALDQIEALLQMGWNKYTDAVTSDGRTIHATSPEACSWCLLGALLKVYRQPSLPSLITDPLRGVMEEIKKDFPPEFYGYGLTGFNDAPWITKAHVLARYRRPKIG